MIENCEGSVINPKILTPLEIFIPNKRGLRFKINKIYKNKASKQFEYSIIMLILNILFLIKLSLE